MLAVRTADIDGMPKDRMALLVSPADEGTLFVAGNADALVWRVDWKQGALAGADAVRRLGRVRADAPRASRAL